MSKGGMTFDDEAVRRKLEQAVDVSKQQFVRTMAYLGEQGVAQAKDRAQSESWYDDTGNLRNSIAYTVLDGKDEVVAPSFGAQTHGTTDGGEGRAKGEAYIKRIANQAAEANNVTLVLVAGMEYASSVEAIQGKDVLASTELLIKSKLPTYIAKTKDRIQSILNKLK